MLTQEAHRLSLISGVEVPVDCAPDEPLLIQSGEQVLEARLSEVIPNIGPALQMKLKLFVQAQIGLIATQLKRDAEVALRKK